MAISPLGNVILTNQNAPVASLAQQQVQGRIDFQNMIASEISQEKKEEIERTRPTEASAEVDPDREHQRQEADEREKQRPKKGAREEEPEFIESIHLLDVKV
jgi:hypothetical protein